MAPAAAKKDDAATGKDKVEVWKHLLYERVRETTRENDSFTQEDLADLAVIPNGDKALLMQVIQELSNDKLFITYRENSGQICWKWRDAQEAGKLVNHLFASVMA